MSKIVFLQPSYAHYREKLFSLLTERHDIHFLFSSSRNTYPGQAKLGNISCEMIDQQYRIELFRLLSCLRKENPDIVISSVSASLRTIVAFLYTLFSRKKMILWIEEWRRHSYNKSNVLKYFIGIVRNFIGKLIIVQSNALVVVGTASREYALALGKNEDEIFMAPQCSDDIAEEGRLSAKKKNKYTFLYLSRIIDLKGLDILIKAFDRLRRERNDISLLIAGDGPFAPYCRELCRSLKTENITFAGSVVPADRGQFFNQADVFVLPSRFIGNFYEGWGLVINEAVSMGLPVITTTAVGAAYDLVVRGHNGFVVQEGSVSDLLKAMQNILAADLELMGENSRKMFERKNNFEKMAEGFSRAIEYVGSNTGQNS